MSIKRITTNIYRIILLLLNINLLKSMSPFFNNLLIFFHIIWRDLVLILNVIINVAMLYDCNYTCIAFSSELTWIEKMIQ